MTEHHSTGMRIERLSDKCEECGMPVNIGDYHPYAACLMFKGCRNSKTVDENLRYVVQSLTDSLRARIRDLEAEVVALTKRAESAEADWQTAEAKLAAVEEYMNSALGDEWATCSGDAPADVVDVFTSIRAILEIAEGRE